ncbi:MAG TPA: ATP synthase subunit I [Epulopiscium sp.]|nr:ATP synthase subunit I [Candidatus Epulonipiscium sp.]
MNEKHDDYQTLMIGTVVIGIIFIIFGLIIHPDKLAWTKGVLFGTVFAALKLALIKKTVTKAIEMSKSDATKHTIGQYTIRYTLTGVVLVVALLEPSINFIGVFAGLFTMKIAIYILLMMGKISK